MKRSEMVKILSNAIIKHMATNDNMTVVASCALRELEDKGMNPPKIRVLIESGYSALLDDIMYMNEWEPEDTEEDDRYCGAV